MNDTSRIDALTPVQTVPRQTQKTGFGDRVSNAINAVVQQGANLVQGVVGSLPVLSSAVAGIQSVTGGMGAFGVRSALGTTTAMAPSMTSLVGSNYANPLSAPATAPSLGGTPGVISAGLGTGSGTSSVQGVMQTLESGGDLTNGQYLVLQQAIQQESQQYTTVSNIIKVRGDSAKSAINNIR